jgi:hypothetical protein
VQVPVCPTLPTATHVLAEGHEIPSRSSPPGLTDVQVVPPFVVISPDPEPTATQVVVEAHDTASSDEGLVGVFSSVQVAPPFVVPMATGVPFSVAVDPTAVQSVAEGHEMPSRVSTPEGAFSAVQLAPSLVVPSMMSAATPAVPTPTQLVPLPHEIAVKGSGVCAKFWSACHDPGGLAADAGVWVGTVSVERAPAAIPATTARQVAPQRNRYARPIPRRSPVIPEPRSMAITPGEEVYLTPALKGTRLNLPRMVSPQTPMRWSCPRDGDAASGAIRAVP